MGCGSRTAKLELSSKGLSRIIANKVETCSSHHASGNQMVNQDHQRIEEIAAKILQEIEALPRQTTPNVRQIRRRYTKLLKDEQPSFILRLSHQIIRQLDFRGLPYELVRYHRSTFDGLDAAAVESLGQGIDSWWTVDAFGRIISGPVWLKRQVGDELFLQWANSSDRWWRRAALVSTVALNMRSQGGYGDADRTLAICDLVISDRDDMVVKAMSWALRELASVEPKLVQDYLNAHKDELAARVKREVRNKLETGLKNPK